MGLFGKMFGGGSPEDDMYKLLSGPSTEMANEMERIYRNQISIYQDDIGSIELSATGILKSRLFGATFMLFAFAQKWKNESAINEMMNASSGIAMESFSSGDYEPKIDRNTAASCSGEFMMDVFRAIVAEMNDGPSTPMNRSVGFDKLVELYEVALKESIGKNTYTSEIHERFFPMIAGAVSANLKHMMEWIKEL